MIRDEPFKEMMGQVDWISVHCHPQPTGRARFVSRLGFLRLGFYEFLVYTLNDGEQVFDADHAKHVMGKA